ncbi:hypothetical protein [Myxosarcina sp. GI1]|uniref:hypothetical protein n=1 Tax=Myxosarcina sp. GI1 TaxID=1541065 RepID=UPI00068A6939|nr:hypothetical protein [Myxosarcina sp. GI1]
MNTQVPQEIAIEKIKMLASFKEDICRWTNRDYRASDVELLRTKILQKVRHVRSIVVETNCLKLMPTKPPSITGGLLIRDYDPFTNVLETPCFGISFIPEIIKMIDEAIRVLKSPKYLAKLFVYLDNRDKTTKSYTQEG